MNKPFRHIIIWAMLICVFITIGVSVNAGTEGPNEEPRVTATFFDSDLRQALNEVSLQTGIVFVCDENIKGVITMDLKNVTLEKALRMMISGGGFVFRRIDDYYLIGLPDPRSPAFPMLCETAVYYFRNIDIESAKALIPENYRSYIKFDPDKNMALLNAPASLIATILADLAVMDGSRSQIRIKALVTEVRRDVLKEWGIDMLKVSDVPADFVKSTVLDLSKGIISINGLSNFGAIYSNIKAMENDKKATIQADPVVVVTEGKTGQLFVGDKRTIVLKPEGTATSSSTQNIEAGTFLKVTPRLYDDQIELTLSQTVSSIDDPGQPDQIAVRTTEFNSVIRFKPGQTILIAGMTANNSSNNLTKTPLLGDIPIIRLFFRQKSDQKSDSELLIFITAEILN